MCNVHSKAARVCADHVCICTSTDDSSAHETEQWMYAKSMCVRGLTPSPGRESAEAVQLVSSVPHTFLHYTMASRCTHIHHTEHRVCLQIHTFAANSKLIRLACLGSMMEITAAWMTYVQMTASSCVSVHQIWCSQYTLVCSQKGILID